MTMFYYRLPSLGLGWNTVPSALAVQTVLPARSAYLGVTR